jgi:polar amino acid transport system substrate-binding protein
MIVFLLFLESVASAESLVLRADTWCPFNCNPKAPQAGYMIDIVREIFKKKGIVIDYQIMNWEQAKKATLAGSIQGVVGASRGDGDFLFPTHPMGKYRNYLFYSPQNGKKKNNKLDTLGALEGAKIGIASGYAYGVEADKFIAKRPDLFVTVSGEDPLTKLIQMMEEGKINALYECPQVFLYKLKTLKKNYEDFRRGLSFDQSEDELFVAFSKKDPKTKKYADILDQGLVELRQSGRLMRLLDNYALTDWE